jgi:thiol-disulfide isomerase/thioredoxin
MSNASNRIFVLILVAVAAVSFVISCSKTETAKVAPPTYYSDEAITTARQLINEGYTLLGQDSLQEALAKFGQLGAYVDSGTQEYHTACAYGRTGDIEKAITNLQSMVARGFDKPDDLKNDSDYENLRGDARFDELVAKAEVNYAAGTASLANGMPVYDTPPVTFATQEEFDDWSDGEQNRLRNQASFWTSSNYLITAVDLTARQLAALKVLKATDPEYDAGLERIRAAARLKSSYEKGWGAVSDLVSHEVAQYLKTNPTEEAAAEANYRAGFAASLKFADDDAKRTGAYQNAAKLFAQVGQESKYYAASQGMMLINSLHQPGTDGTALGVDLKALIEKYPTDENLYRVIATQTDNSAAKYLWPLALTGTDLTGKEITLADYNGKTLLIDFWATWCPPCRAELPNLVDVYNRYHGQGFEIVSISLDYSDRITTDEYKQWIDSAGMTWRHTYDGSAWSTPMVKKFFVGSIPAPFLVGPDGSLAAMGEDLRGDKLEETVKASLGI